MRERLTLLAVAVVALAVPAGATAGGWATVELDSVPEGVAPGEPWRVELTILQHGVTPLEGVRPRVIVSKAGETERQAFPARATSEPGVYRADVVFASAGTWTYAVDDGFMGERTYPPVSIGRSGEERVTATAGLSGAGSDGPDYLLAFAVAAIAGLAAGLAAAAVQRRRGGPASAG
jgi:YtkA-like